MTPHFFQIVENKPHLLSEINVVFCVLETAVMASCCQLI